MPRPTGMECGGFGEDTAAGELGAAVNDVTTDLNRLLNRLGPPPQPSLRLHTQMIGRVLRPRPEQTTVIEPVDLLSLADAQRLGFLPTAEIVPLEGTEGAGQYVRETESVEPVGEIAPAPQPQQPQGEIN